MVYSTFILDINEYIASGILETVALGLATEQEQKEVRCLAAIYPEIQEEFARVQTTIEKHFHEQNIAPSSEVKSAILAEIRQTNQEKETSEAPIIALKTSDQPNPWKYIAAACIILSFGLTAMLFVNKSKLNESQHAIALKEKDMTKMGQMMDVMTLEQEHMQEVQKVLADEKTKTVMLMGTAMEPDAKVKIMWSNGMKKAVIHADKIAPPPVNMQYQLWAIVDGKPMSIGVFTYDEVEQMSDPFEVAVTNVSAFAITLEKMGGNPTPTMEKMVVIGTTNS